MRNRLFQLERPKDDWSSRKPANGAEDACGSGANLARESIWTVVSREEKFKAKNIVDGTVFRGADTINAQVLNLLSKVLALSVPVIAAIAAAIAVGWLLLSLALGRKQKTLARIRSKE
jgi:ATP:ADP antiporter, AAA family